VRRHRKWAKSSLEDEVQFNTFGRQAATFFNCLNAELGPMVRRGEADLQSQHFKHSVRPLMLSIDQTFDDPVLNPHSPDEDRFRLPCNRDTFAIAMT
jgi:hypothetical protein